MNTVKRLSMFKIIEVMVKINRYDDLGTYEVMWHSKISTKIKPTTGLLPYDTKCIFHKLSTISLKIRREREKI